MKVIVLEVHGELVVAARPVRYQDYSPGLQRVHRATIDMMGMEPQIDPHTSYVRCQECHIEVALGPEHRATIIEAVIERDQAVRVLCMIDAITYACAAEVRACGFDDGDR